MCCCGSRQRFNVNIFGIQQLVIHDFHVLLMMFGCLFDEIKIYIDQWHKGLKRVSRKHFEQHLLELFALFCECLYLIFNSSWEGAWWWKISKIQTRLMCIYDFLDEWYLTQGGQVPLNPLLTLLIVLVVNVYNHG